MQRAHLLRALQGGVCEIDDQHLGRAAAGLLYRRAQRLAIGHQRDVLAGGG